MSSLIWAIEASNLRLGENSFCVLCYSIASHSVVEVLLETYPALLEKGDQEGLKPLHYAALNGQVHDPFILFIF
jgi:hypothetical protein